MGAKWWIKGGRYAQKERRKRATLRGPGGTLWGGEDHAPRKHTLDNRSRSAQRLRARKEHGRRRLARSAQSPDERRDQLRDHALHGRILHLPRLPRLYRISSGDAERPSGRRHGRGGL